MAALALTVFGWNLAAEPHFVDESAYISQSFYADLWITGRWNDPTWLTYAGYDLPPLPKYAIGLALRCQGYRRPGSATMFAWYQNTSRQFVSIEALVAARRASVLFGVMGVLAMYALGTLAWDRRLGGIAAVLLVANPLYALHARRAMSDVYAESLILAAAVVGLWAWRRLLSGGPALKPLISLGIGCGILSGLATLSKLNGSLGGFVLGAWAVLALGLMRFSGRRRGLIALATLLAGAVAVSTFTSLNPFLFAHPPAPIDPRLEPVARLGFLERAGVISDHRIGVSALAKSQFPNDALGSIRDRLEAVIVQGFGRFGPFGPRGRSDSTVRLDWKQDRGAVVWLPVVALGFCVALVRGRRQLGRGEPPTAWAIVLQAIVAGAVVTAFIPLAWDRYFLSIQPGFALLGSFAILQGFDLIRGSLVRQPEAEPLA